MRESGVVAGRKPEPGAPPRPSRPWQEQALADLLQASTETGLPVSLAVQERLQIYLRVLATWAPQMDLIGPDEAERFGTRHLADAWRAVGILRDHPAGRSLRLIDVGSGGGLPGVPLALGLELPTAVLLEPRRRRANFLRAVDRALEDHSFEVVEARSENLVAQGAVFDAVVTRATFPPSRVAPECGPLVASGGLLLAWIARDVPVEGLIDPHLGAPRILSSQASPVSGLAVWRRG